MDEHKHKRVYISYRDDSEIIVSGYVDLIEETELYVKFRTKQNVITLSRSRVIKIKEAYQDGQ